MAIKRNRLRWTGRLQPTSASEEYLLAVSCDSWRRPTVVVLSPQLEIPEGKSLPHTSGSCERSLGRHLKSWSCTLDVGDLWSALAATATAGADTSHRQDLNIQLPEEPPGRPDQPRWLINIATRRLSDEAEPFRAFNDELMRTVGAAVG